jgi:hypothetical protein
VDTIVEMLTRGIEQLAGRAGGPLNFRLVVMPTVVTLLGLRAGLRDARAGRQAFLWLTDSVERRALLQSAMKDVGRVFVVAVVLDTIYQLYVLRAFYPAQVVIVAVACAVVPYVISRAVVNRLARRPPPHTPGPAAPHRT